MKPLKVQVLIVICMLVFQFAHAQEKYSTVKIYTPSDKSERARLIGLLQIDHFQELENGVIITEIGAGDLAKLRTTAHRYEILVDDVAKRLETLNRKFYAERAKGIDPQQQRLAMEQNQKTVDDIIAEPTAFTVQPTFGGYYSFAQMEAAMNTLVASYPTIAQKISLGQSHEGRDIWCIKISDQVATDQLNEPEVLFIGLQHAREAIGGSSMIFLMQYLCQNYGTDTRIRDLVDNREVFIIPCMNPDGWEYNRNNGGVGSGWRKNRRDNAGSSWGVDLNRNWGVDWGNCSSPIIGDPTSCGSSDGFDDTYYGTAPFSEPETQAIRNFTYTKHFIAMIDQHAYGPYYSLPFGRPSLATNVMSADDDKFYTYISAAMGTYNGMRSGNSPQALGYEVAGGVKDWMLKGNVGTGTKGKVYGMTGEGGAGGGTGGSFGSFWAPASEIVNLCKGMTYQNLQLLYAAGSYVNLQDASDIDLASTSGSFDFKITRVGLENQPVDITVVPLENVRSVGSTVTVSSLTNYGDTYSGSITYSLSTSVTNGKRVRFAWRIQTGGYTYYDTVTKFYNPVTIFSDDMEGSTVGTNWAVTGGWNYTTERAYGGTKSLTESPGGNYSSSSIRRATYTGTIDLSDATASWVSFWVRHRAENFRDKLQVQVSDDGGASWTAIAGTTTIQEPGTLDGSTINGNPSLTGIREEWTRELFDLEEWLNTPALRIRLEFTSSGATSYDFSEDEGFHIDDFKVVKSITPLITLPVHFISFTGRLQQNEMVRLDWKAVTDEMHDNFHVEKSLNGTDFTQIGKGPAVAPYWMIDANPAIGNNYYRVRQTDKDGRVTYSQVINVFYDPANYQVTVYPNPVTDFVQIKFTSNRPEQYLICITDLTGRKVYEESIATSSGSKELNIPFSQMAAQLYILTVKNGRNEIVSTQRIAKQ
ncbi:MAG: T9SS type A sorting domain-containing protein [Chitinophagaceae bacterium]|nr:T9SS type A sorting domain-containing protein [Chitinophagaceae bacterium]